jgi:release factor glutamine methyltransferase
MDTEDRMTLRELLMTGAARLRAAGIEPAALDASLLLANALTVSRAALYARLTDVASVDDATAYISAIERRAHGDPVAYIVGQKEFFGLDFEVSHAVLVPRPETELLVQWAIDWLRERVLPARVIDVGTGSGAIAVTVAHTVESAQIFAADISLEAIAIARRNAKVHGVGERIGFVCGDLLAWLGQPADLILANLPYLTDAQMHERSIAAEPRLALAGGGGDGFCLYRCLLRQAVERLMPGGAFAFEIDPAQAVIVETSCRDAFPTASITVHNDLAGHARLVTVEAALENLVW